MLCQTACTRKKKVSDFYYLRQIMWSLLTGNAIHSHGTPIEAFAVFLVKVTKIANFNVILSSNPKYCFRFGIEQARRKNFGSGAAIGTKKTAGGRGGAVSPPAGPGQSPGGGPGGEAPGSSVNLGILKP